MKESLRDVKSQLIRDNLVYIDRITMAFRNVLALSNVSMRIGHNEIVGLLGNNGAGKTTLVNILAGNYLPNSGDIYIDGRRVTFKSPKDAIAQGIETKYQNLDLVDNLSVYRNFFLGREINKGITPFTGKFFHRSYRRLDKRSMIAKSRELFKELGISSDDFVLKTARTLSGGERQTVLTARVIYFSRKLIILDEPTISLSQQGVQTLLGLISKAKAKGLSVLFITHNASEVFQICDRFVLLQNGRNFADFKKDETNVKELEKLFIYSKLTAMQQQTAIAAHQFNNPLAIMKVAAEMLHNKLQTLPDNLDYLRLSSILTKKIDTLQLIVHSCLDYSRPLKFQKTYVSLSDLVENVLDDIPISRFPGIEINTNGVNPDVGKLMDKNLMKQALVNLLLNALESSHVGGCVDIRGYDDGGSLVIEVQDYGVGMDEQTQKMMFNYFFTTKDFGTGLGLAIVEQIIQQHNGTIHVESAPSRGSVFRVEI